jgi:hypothetical protein
VKKAQILTWAVSKNDSFNSYGEVCKRVRDFEELIAIKDSTIAALTSELDSFRELISNTSSNSLGTSTTEYKQFQEECHNKVRLHLIFLFFFC